MIRDAIDKRKTNERKNFNIISVEAYLEIKTVREPLVLLLTVPINEMLKFDRTCLNQSDRYELFRAP